uniref:Uncharacterized protein n=1 Tax=Mycobacterium leprae TaxID=1769 RepID=O33033_MYCLR|nr:hypothetical protein MLCB250.58 [Mycobacterium leprae]
MPVCCAASLATARDPTFRATRCIRQVLPHVPRHSKPGTNRCEDDLHLIHFRCASSAAPDRAVVGTKHVVGTLDKRRAQRCRAAVTTGT